MAYFETCLDVYQRHTTTRGISASPHPSLLKVPSGNDKEEAG